MQLPENWGKCFDTAALAVIRFPAGARLCHGLGFSNVPGEESTEIMHAWVELNGEAYDSVWMVRQDAKTYRENLKLFYVVEYTVDQVWREWFKNDHPGPWDARIKQHADRQP